MRISIGKTILSTVFILMLAVTIHAQRMIIEYFEGNNIVLYTAEYRLYLADDVKAGFALPMGSLIETGAKTTVELKIEPQGTVIKLAENSTLKITGLAGYSSADMNELKLISGTVRVIAQVPRDEKPIVLSGPLTDSSTREADFGMVVRKLEEESVIVLKGEVAYTGSGKGSMNLSNGDMANEFDRDLRPRTASADYRKAIGSLEFKGIADLPLIRGSGESVAYDLPQEASAPPDLNPTPVPKAGTSDATPEATAGGGNNTDSKTSGEGDKNSAPITETSAKLTDTGNQAASSSGQLMISESKPGGLVAMLDLPKGTQDQAADVLTNYKVDEIYNVYKKTSKTGATVIYSDFVGTVYLKEIDKSKNALVFSYMQDGDSSIMAKGFFLNPSGRTFTPPASDKSDIAATKGADSNPGATSASGQKDKSTDSAGKEKAADTAPQPAATNDSFLGLEVGLGVTYTHYLDPAINAQFALFDAFIPILSTILKLKGYLFADLYIKPIPNLGIGIESGFAYFTYTYTDSVTGMSFTFTNGDIPMRGFIRFGMKGLFIEGFGGYYLNIMPGTGVSGIEGGLRFAFGGAYIECAYLYGSIQILRFAVGYALSFLPGQL